MRHRISAEVAWVDDADIADGREAEARAYVTRLPDGAPLVLAGSAWAVWRALAAYDDSTMVANSVAELLGVELTDQVRTDVDAFIAELTRSGLLERS